MVNLTENLRKNTSVERERKTDVQRLMDVINNRIDSRIVTPFGFPQGAQEAAKYWINFLEPRMFSEAASDIVDPYQERLVDCLVRYYRLNQSDQRYLTGLREKGIYWRGESIDFMKLREKVDMKKINKPSLFQMMKKVIFRG